jgi:hypothetical protein
MAKPPSAAPRNKYWISFNLPPSNSYYAALQAVLLEVLKPELKDFCGFGEVIWMARRGIGIPIILGLTGVIEGGWFLLDSVFLDG